MARNPANLTLFGILLAALLAVFVIAYKVSEQRQKRACATKGYPRAVNAGLVWPNIKCVKLVNGTEVTE